MPISSHRVPIRADGDDIWYRHKAEIKNLYQDQGKKLSEVKLLMEKSGFPKAPLSTWESKLRESLQLRKKAKINDWPLIYQHVLPHLEHPGGKRLKRDIIICLNDTEIPWEKVWKEIRRSGAHRMIFQSPVSPLPPGVTIQVPSPGPSSPITAPPAAQPGNSNVSTCSNPTTTLAVSQMRTPLAVGVLEKAAGGSTVKPSESAPSLDDLLQCSVSSVPWLELCQSMPQIIRGSKYIRQLENSFSFLLQKFLATGTTSHAARSRIQNSNISSKTSLDLLVNNRTITPRPSPDLGYRLVMSAGHAQLWEFILTAIYLLANRLHDQGDGDRGLNLLFLMFDRDSSLMTKILSIRAPSIRAAWEALLKFTMEHEQRDRFRILIDIGIHNRWLNPSRPGEHLYSAVQMDCYETVEDIVAYCRGFDCGDWWQDSIMAIIEACWKDNVECAKLLIRQCDANAMFADAVFTIPVNESAKTLALELLLADGAEVDQYCNDSENHMPLIWRRLVGQHEVFEVTRPTLLDAAFYFDRTLFDKLVPLSTVPDSRITRTRLLIGLEHGPQALRDYLSAPQFATPSCNWQHVPSIFELLLAEQFEIPELVDMRIVRSLFELGVDFRMPSIELDVQDLLCQVCHWSGRHKFANATVRRELLEMLLKSGGHVGEKHLAAAVGKDGLGDLEYLAPHVKDFPTKAAQALAKAAHFNNFEAVGFLFQKGVDPDAFIVARGRSYSIQAVATGALDRGQHSECSVDMIQFLAKHGARLVVTPKDLTPFDFTNHLLEKSASNTFVKVQYVLGKLQEGEISSTIPASLLESCLIPCNGIRPRLSFTEERLGIFEYFYKLQGAEVSPGSPLAALVAAGGREDLVRDLLSSGSDLNAYWAGGFKVELTPLQVAAMDAKENFVRLFLQKGADVNSPARGFRGKTALQAICGWSPATEEEHQRKTRICRSLLDKGADVNAPCSQGGLTALTLAAIMGDLELAALLLSQGARINALSSEYSDGTALDAAAFSGRLDMVEFLLNCNALSSVRGVSGYDGAISIAERSHYFTVADLIRRHAAEVEAGIYFNPEL